MKKIIFSFILGILVCGTVVYAATLIDSKDVTYTPSDNNFDANNVKKALDELYNKMQIVRGYTETNFGTSHTPGVTFPVTMTIRSTSDANVLIVSGHLSGTSGLPTFTILDVEDSHGNKLEKKSNYQGTSANQNGAVSSSFIYTYQCEPDETYTITYTANNTAHSYYGGNVMAYVIKEVTNTTLVKEHTETNFGTSHTPGVTFPVTMTITAPSNSNALVINGHLTGTSGLAYFDKFDVKDSHGNIINKQYIEEGVPANQNGGISKSFVYVYHCNPGETYTITYSAVNPSHSYYGGNVMATIY